jgi:hypothetical protein
MGMILRRIVAISVIDGRAAQKQETTGEIATAPVVVVVVVLAMRIIMTIPSPIVDIGNVQMMTRTASMLHVKKETVGVATLVTAI